MEYLRELTDTMYERSNEECKRKVVGWINPVAALASERLDHISYDARAC
jgi:hypothetical protein